MATANHKIDPCTCTHDQKEHRLVFMKGYAGECKHCACRAFTPAQKNLKEGEQLRRITED